MKDLKSVLLIDDDPVSNFINARLIKTLGFTKEISISKNGKEALSYLTHLVEADKSCPELIFLDINMPVMDGFEFISAFKKLSFPNKDSINIVILSTSSYYKDIEKFNTLNITDFIIKPLTKEKIKPVLSKLFIEIN